jgi:hypothetical protein
VVINKSSSSRKTFDKGTEDPVEIYNNKATFILDKDIEDQNASNDNTNDENKNACKLENYILGKQIG